MESDSLDNYEALVQFLYRAPIGLVQIAASGEIEMLNPMSAQLLMPLAPGGDLDNLYAVLGAVAPDLRKMTEDFGPLPGIVCDGIRLDLGLYSGPGVVQVLSLSLLKLDSGALMAVLADATQEVERERKKLERGLSTAARIDHLTQMPNRAAVHETLQRLLDARAGAGVDTGEGAGIAVFFMNCDRFKQINDLLGHAAGDQVLGVLAERLRSGLRSGDRASRATGAGPMAARVGSDEFVVIIDGMRRADDVMRVARRVLDSLFVPCLVDGQQITCHVSMGVVMEKEAGRQADIVLQDASIAMVEAKRAGGARYVVFDPVMRERAAQRGGIEADLRRALAGNEMFVVYQPVVGLQTGGDIDRSVGVEALVRWRHPVRGVVSPLEFIGVAEECGLIGAIGEYVLAMACTDFMDWRARLGVDAPRLMAVNLSRAQLADLALPRRVHDILARTGMPASCLQLEITESLAAQDDSVQRQLHELKSLGLKLALDDFGTGYSSLACLHLLPVDTVKIDRSFVSQADTSAHHRVLIEATVRVAHSLGMDTVAEGIETCDQSNITRQLGCDKGQGYLYSRPLSAADLVSWLTVITPATDAGRPDSAVLNTG